MSLGKIAEALLSMNEIQAVTLSEVFREGVAGHVDRETLVQDLTDDGLRCSLDVFEGREGNFSGAFSVIDGAPYEAFVRVLLQNLKEHSNYGTTIEEMSDAMIWKAFRSTALAFKGSEAA